MSGDSMRVMHPLFQVEDGGAIPTSPLQMRVTEIPFLLAKHLNQAWHSRLPEFGAIYSFSFGAQYDGKVYAVAMWSNPVARNLPQHTWLELRRMAVSPDSPRHTPSWMLGVMTRMIRKSLPDIERLVSYSDTAVHLGTIYKASGWTCTTLSEGGEWCRPSRDRPVAQSSAPKQRWERSLL